MTYHNVDPAAVMAVNKLAAAISELAKALTPPAPAVTEKPWCNECAGPFSDAAHLLDYGGHWDTCPNRRGA